MALKRNDFPQGTLHSTYVPHTHRNTVHTVRTLLIICIASFFDSLMMIFSLVSRRLKRLKEPCGNYVRYKERQSKRAGEAERGRGRQRERASQLVARDRLEPNASNMKNKKKHFKYYIHSRDDRL